MIEVRYVWTQTIENGRRPGSTRWQPLDPLMPDCTAPGMSTTASTTSRSGWRTSRRRGLRRTGTLTGGGERFDADGAGLEQQPQLALELDALLPRRRDGGRGKTLDLVRSPIRSLQRPPGRRRLRAEDRPDGIRLSGLQDGRRPAVPLRVGRRSHRRHDRSARTAIRRRTRSCWSPAGNRTSASRRDRRRRPVRARRGRLQAVCVVWRAGRRPADEPGYYLANTSPYVPGGLSPGASPTTHPETGRCRSAPGD